MYINTNISSLNAQRNLTATGNAMQKSLEKLSSGYRINRAADDAAGLAISEKMRGQIRGLAQAQRNAQDGISLLQTAEGALNETHSILQRMRELSNQASSGTLQSTDRTAITSEMGELSSELNRIADATQFNGTTLLNGTFGSKLDSTNSTVASGGNQITGISVTGAAASETYTITQTANTVQLADSKGNTQILSGLAGTFSGTLNFDKLGVSFDVSGADLSGAATWGADSGLVVTTAAANVKLQIGANAGQTMDISIDDMSARSTGLNLSGTQISVADTTSAATTLSNVNGAIDTVSSQRSKLGAWQNRLEHTIANLATAEENMTAAESRIRDVDMAKEMSEFTKTQVLSQAGVAMLAQANQAPQGILKLLG